MVRSLRPGRRRPQSAQAQWPTPRRPALLQIRVKFVRATMKALRNHEHRRVSAGSAAQAVRRRDALVGIDVQPHAARRDAVTTSA